MDGTRYAARKGESFIDDSAIQYQLDDRSALGAIEWVEMVPLDGTTITAGGQSRTIPVQAEGFIAPAHGLSRPYFRFQVNCTNPGAGTTPVIEPWNFLQSIDVLVNGTSVVMNQANLYQAIATSDVMRKNFDWAATEGAEMGLVSTAGAAMQHPLYARPTCTNGSVFCVPLPEDFSILCNRRSAFPLSLISDVKVKIVSAPFTSYTGTAHALNNGAAVGADIADFSISNLGLWVPITRPHPAVVDAVRERLLMATRDPEESLVITTGICEVFSGSIPARAGSHTIMMPTAANHTVALEAVLKPASANTNAWRSSASVRDNTASYFWRVNNMNVSQSPITTAGTIQTMKQAYTDYNDYVYALAHAQRSPVLGSIVPIHSFVMDTIPDNTPASLCPYFSMVAPLTSSSRDHGVSSDAGTSTISLTVQKDANGTGTECVILRYGYARLLLSYNACRMQI